jgi:hypothetical protein
VPAFVPAVVPAVVPAFVPAFKLEAFSLVQANASIIKNIGDLDIV